MDAFLCFQIVVTIKKTGKEEKMMSKDIIQVRAVQDREFKNSYWSFDIRSELTKAFQEFQRQFGVGFELTGIGEWDSVGSPDLRDFPFNVIQMIPRRLSIEEIIEYLVGVCKKDMGVLLEVCQSERDEICSKMEGQSIAYQLGFWEGRLESWLKECFFRDLEKKEIMDSGIGATIAFSGKFSIWLRSAGCVKTIGGIFTKDAYILIGNCPRSSKQPSKVILHEIGHLFGAKHTKYFRSVMKSGQQSTYKFDFWNKRRILNKIK